MSKFFTKHKFFTIDSQDENEASFAVTHKTIQCTDIDASVKFRIRKTVVDSEN